MIKTCFSPTYNAKTSTTSMRKLKLVAEVVERTGLAELIKPEPVCPDKLRKLHNPKFVNSFLSGEGPLSESQGWDWTSEIRDGVMAINGGQLKAAELAFENGISANIAQGFHHSGYEEGESFCTFNGLALVAQENPDKKIFVLDCDAHGGNGTSDFVNKLTNLFNYSICGSHWDFVEGKRSVLKQVNEVNEDFSIYADALNEAFKEILKWKPDLIIYQAGADAHINDPLGCVGMTTSQMQQRDEMVFQFCLNNNTPVMFVLAGGYQTPMEEKLIPLHVNTFKAANKVFAK